MNLSRRTIKRYCVYLAVSLGFLLPGCNGAKSPQFVKIPAEVMDAQGRDKIRLNADWQFRLGPENPSKAIIGTNSEQDLAGNWEDISLPHTWNVDDGEDGGGDYYRGEGWYKKKFFADNSLRGLRAYLEFDAANQVTDVWLNGEHIGQHKGGYARFRFDVTAALQYEATNLLTVRVSNAFDANIPPLSGDWTFYGGIYRDVSLLFTKPVHIDVTDYASDGLYLAQHKVSAEQADIGLKVLLRNDGKSDTTIESRATLLDASGKVVLQQSQDQQLSAGEMSVWQSAMRIEKPRLWHGRHDPYLYTVRVSLLSDGQLLDQIEHPLGLRFYHVDPERGFFLNGEPYALYGAALHQDRLGKGWAVNDQDRIEDFDLLDELGVRTLRLAHYQHDELVYRLADERGIILWTELGLVNSISASEEFAESAKQQLKELVRQRYNHPSILFWGLFNEITMRDGPDPVPLARELQTLVKTEDPGRLSAAAVLGNVAGSSSDIWKATDLVAGNVYFGWYYDSVENLSDWVTRVHQTSPATRFAVSEYGAGASESIHSADPIAQDHSEEYQALLHEKSWAKLGQASSLWASYIWAAFDFSSDARNEGSYAGRNNKGLITGDRKIKKDAFYFYKAQWNPEPMVHINGRRFTERTRESSDIKVYANDGTVELKLNGKSLGIKKVDATRILVWEDVELQLGENKIVAIATTEKGEQLRDSIRLQRILNNDTDLASEIMGVDLARRLLVNPPYKLSISALDKVLQRPFGASWELLDAKTSDPFLAVGSTLRVTAANGDSVDYKVISAELSRARNASANRELKEGVMGYPDGLATNANDGVRNTAGADLKTLNLWTTADPTREGGWWKVDLGSDYYIDTVQIDWLPSDITEDARVFYTVDVAKEVGRGFDVIGETFNVAVNRLNNSEAHVVKDRIGRVGRHVRVNIKSSEYKVDIPLMGTFGLTGMSEITVNGGLIYADSLSIDYRRREITLPAPSTVTALMSDLQIVEGVTLRVESASGEALHENTILKDGAVLVASKQDRLISEAYRLRW